MELSTVEQVFTELSGLTIESGARTDDGMHVYLSDGRVLVFAGDFIVGVMVLDKTKLQ